MPSLRLSEYVSCVDTTEYFPNAADVCVSLSVVYCSVSNTCTCMYNTFTFCIGTGWVLCDCPLPWETREELSRC